MWWFLPYINMSQPQVYVCPLPLGPPSHDPPHPTPLGYHRAPALDSLHHTTNSHQLSIESVNWYNYFGICVAIICWSEITKSCFFQVYSKVCMEVLVTQSCPFLWDPMDCSPPGSSVHGDSPGEIGSGLSCPLPGDLSHSGTEPVSPVALHCRQILYHWATREAPQRSLEPEKSEKFHNIHQVNFKWSK